jgi:hypothetical protein
MIGNFVQKCSGYEHLPDFPTVQPDPSIRRAAYPLPTDSPENAADIIESKKISLEDDEYLSVESGSEEDNDDEEEYEEEDIEDEDGEQNDESEDEEGL